MEEQFSNFFFRYLDSEKNKYKTGEISKNELKDIFIAHKKSFDNHFLNEYYKYIIDSGESEEFINDFLSIFPDNIK
jgi:hypothetical protein